MDVDRYDEVAERELVEVPRARHTNVLLICIINYYD